MTELELVLKAGSLAFSVGKYTGILEDKLGLKIDQLAGSELDAGIRALKQSASSQAERTYLLREARSRFNKAISLEKGLRLASAHLGLALCHVNLGDADNAERSIRDLVQVSAPDAPLMAPFAPVGEQLEWMEKNNSRKDNAIIIGVLLLLPFSEVFVAPLALAGLIGKKQKQAHQVKCSPLIELKQEANKLLEMSLSEGSDKVFGIADR